MLVLSRKVGETIHIGDNITLTITRIERDKVRLSIDAPREVVILRNELYEEMNKETEGTPQPRHS